SFRKRDHFKSTGEACLNKLKVAQVINGLAHRCTVEIFPFQENGVDGGGEEDLAAVSEDQCADGAGNRPTARRQARWRSFLKIQVTPIRFFLLSISVAAGGPGGFFVGHGVPLSAC